MMLKFADLIDQNVEELAALDSLDAGKLYSFAKLAEIPNAAEKLRYYAGAADKIHGSTLKMSGQLHGYTVREPIGVVGLIIPWNFPSQMFTMKVGPALAAGCTMVVKPAEQTPLSVLFLAHLAKLVRLFFWLLTHLSHSLIFHVHAGWHPRWSDECGDGVWPLCWGCNKLPHGYRQGHHPFMHFLVK